MCCHNPCAKMLSVGGRGGLRMRRGSPGSAASARPGKPSVTRLIQRIWIGCSGYRQPEKRREEQRRDLTDIAAHDEAHEFADVVEDPPTLANGGDDRREVVVEQYHRCGLARDVGADLAHGDADVGSFERGRVVHAVAGHRDVLAGRLQRVDDADLLLRARARIHAHLTHTLRELLVGQPRELPACESQRAGLGNAEPHRDRRRGGRMIARDHHRRDAGRFAVADGCGDLAAWRIDEAHETDERQVALDGVGLDDGGQCRKPAHREREHALSLPRELLSGPLLARAIDLHVARTRQPCNAQW